MNTKQSVAVGWMAYTAAFAIGGSIGWYKFYYAPGGRRDREEIADAIDRAREQEEREYEDRIRAQRKEARGSPPK